MRYFGRMRFVSLVVIGLFSLVSLPLACSSSSDAVGGDGGGVGDSGTSADTSSPPIDGAVTETGAADGNIADGAGVDGSSDAGGTLSDKCITKVNAYRAKVGAPPIARKVDQEVCAASQAQKGATDLKLTGKTVFHAYYGQCKEGYQNECWYSEDAPDAVIDWCLDAFWKEGPPETGINHYSVMTDPASTTMACGFFHMETGGYWMTQDYYR